MMKLTTLDKLFRVEYGTDLELNKLNSVDGDVRFISRTRKNNGLSAYVHRIDGIAPNPANTISVALGSSSVLFAFLQEKPYYSGRDIAYLEPIYKLTKNEMLFYCTCITANRFRYNYGRQANKTIAKLMIPEICEIPEWVNRTEIKDLSHLDENILNEQIEKPYGYKLFDFDKVFDFAREQEHEGKIFVNLISALTKNNGVKAVVETNSYIDGNKITITSNGIYTGTAFYQEQPFTTQDSIAVELLNKELNKYIAMYLLCLINNEKFRYNYGRKSSKSKLLQMKLLLPITNNEQPDWDYMEKYIKTIPYSKSI